MAEFIIHLNGAYNIFGTIADGAHYESALTLDQLREVIREQRGELGLSDLPARLNRAHADGCSAFHMDLEDCISSNRQGPNESRLSRDEFIKRFLTLSTPVPKRDAAMQGTAGVRVTFGTAEPRPPCTVCDKPAEQHGTYPTCATHPYTPDGNCGYVLGARCVGAECVQGCVRARGVAADRPNDPCDDLTPGADPTDRAGAGDESTTVVTNVTKDPVTGAWNITHGVGGSDAG